LDSGIINSEHQKTLEALTENVLGPAESQTPEKPQVVQPNKTYQGGTAFERSDRAISVKGLRCYTTAYSYQDAPNIASATTGSKRTEGDPDNLAIHTAVNRVCFPLPILTITYKPLHRLSQPLRLTITTRPPLETYAMFLTSTGI